MEKSAKPLSWGYPGTTRGAGPTEDRMGGHAPKRTREEFTHLALCR
jgi:hypothetical protein